ncbi:MAG TPA: hypothetical protein VLA72_06540, partial [Anaerolineales bacterium]|nr:hypothetical protein [Anaerolineales bacterium]
NVGGVPEAIAVDESGTVYVTDYRLGRMQVFDNDGNFLWALSGESVSKPLFNSPTGVAFDVNGRIFIVNQGFNKISVYQ